MSNHSTANGLVQAWLPVTDSEGRTRLEAHWFEMGSHPAIHVTHAA